MKTRMIVIIALVLLMGGQTASATWAFERAIQIDNTGNPALNDHAVYIDLSGVSPVISESSLRVVDKTSNTTMSHWSFDVGDGNVYGAWFIAPYIPAGSWCNSTYCIRYVNCLASSTSSVGGVGAGFAYADDFDDFWDFVVHADTVTYSGWTFYSDHAWSSSGSRSSFDDRNLYAGGNGWYSGGCQPGNGKLTSNIPSVIGNDYVVMHMYTTTLGTNTNTKFYIGGAMAESYSSTTQPTLSACTFTATDVSTQLRFNAQGAAWFTPYSGGGGGYYSYTSSTLDVSRIAVQDVSVLSIDDVVIGFEEILVPASLVPDYYSSISSAVSAACARGGNETILVRDGTYTENIAFPTGCNNITIISENGSANTIIEAADWGSPTISLSSNDNVTIEGFTIKDGSYGIAIDSGSSNVTLQNNLLTTNFNAGLYITGSHPDLSITNCTSSYNQDGAVLYNCQQANIDDLDCTYNYDTGIELQNADYITIDDCTLAYNANNGIELISSSDFNTISNNTIEYNNDYGVAITSGSDYNKIYNNKFTNGANGYDEGLNTWYTTMSEGTNIIGGQFTGGNYYSDYTGEDADHDGIGDTPYEIAGGGGIDMLPLSGVGMWVIFDAPSHLIGDDVTVSYHLTDSAFSTYDYFVEVRDDTNTLLETWSIGYNEDSGEYDFYLKYGWRTGEYTVYLWRTPKAGGGEVLLSQDTLSVGERMFISGVSYDVQNNITLSDVLVTFTQESTEYTDTTDGSGYYEIESLNVDKLTWINVSKTGYTHSNFSMTLLAAMAYEIDLYLLPEEPYREGNAIGGVVTSFPFHQAIESATVSLENATWSDTITTNIFGFYSFENIVSGTYNISAAKAGYSTYTPDTVSI